MVLFCVIFLSLRTKISDPLINGWKSITKPIKFNLILNIGSRSVHNFAWSCPHRLLQSLLILSNLKILHIYSILLLFSLSSGERREEEEEEEGSLLYI